MSDVYELATVADLLKIPPDKLSECLRDIEYAINLCHFAGGDEAAGMSFDAFTWTDDGKHSVNMSMNGEPFLNLDVTDSGPVQASEARGDSTDPHPRWNAEKPSARHPQDADGWDWHKDGPENGGGLERSRRRLAVASDYADPRAPDQMALVLRVDVMRVLHSLTWRESQSESRARQIAELSAHTQAGPVG